MQKEYIVTARQNQTSKNGTRYGILKVSAQKGEVFTITVWDLDESDAPHVEDLISVDLETVRSIKFPKKSDFGNFRNCRKAVPADELYGLIPRPINKEEWDQCLDHLLGYCTDELLIGFINAQREELYDNYSTQTAATAMHHAFKGGLLNHTYELLRMLDGLYPSLPPVKLERCIIAILFHDFGKLKEYDANMEPTKYMYLLGHTYISSHVLHNRLNEAGVSNEETIRIIHCVLSHHGQKEFGSPVVPCTQEAIVVHHVDHLSAQTNACEDTGNMEKNFALGTCVVK